MPGKKKTKSLLKELEAPALTKVYLFEDLPADLIAKLTIDHRDQFAKFLKLTKLFQANNTPTLPPAIKESIESTIEEFQATLALFDTDERLRNLQEQSFLNRDYFRATYLYQLSFLYLLIGDTFQAREQAHCAFIECKHPILIRNYFFMSQNFLITEEHQGLYLLKILQSNFALGNFKQRKEIEEVFLFNKSTKEQTLTAFSKTLYDLCLAQNNQKGIEQLLLALTEAFPDLKTQGSFLLFQYIKACLQQASVDLVNIDQLMAQNPSLIVPKHYALLIKYTDSKLFLGEPYHRLHKYYLKQAIDLGDLDAKFFLASYFIKNEDQDNIAQALRLISEIQKEISKRKESSDLRGSCYHALGTIYDFGLSSDPNYKQNDKKAFEFYLKAAQLDFAPACQDLAIMYRDGQGISQDLEQAKSWLKKSIALGNSGAKTELAQILFLQSSLAPTAALRAQLLQEALTLLKERLNLTCFLEQDLRCMNVPAAMNVPQAELARAHFFAAFLLLAQDLNLKHLVDESGRVSMSVPLQSLIGFSVNTGLNTAAVHNQLQQALRYGYKEAGYFLALFLHYGTYLEQDLIRAEKHYLLCHAQGLENVPVQLLTLYLSQSAQATELAEKKTYLLKALNWHWSLLKEADAPSKLKLDALFSESVGCWRSQDLDPNQLTRLRDLYRQHQSAVLPLSSRESKDRQLIAEINKLIPLLQQPPQDKLSFESQLLTSFFNITHLLKNFRSEVLSCKEQFAHLYQIQELLLVYFTQLSLDTQIELISLCCRWPLLHKKQGAMEALLLLIRHKELSFALRVKFALALSYLKDETGILETDLIRLFFNELDVLTSIPDILTASRLLYIFASTHANGSQLLTPTFLKQKLDKLLPFLLPYLNTHCWEANSNTMSQMYYALYYLIQVYPETFAALPEHLDHFIHFNKEHLRSNELVCISNQQRQVYQYLYDKGFIQEEFVGGRSVDLFNPETREAVFFHGPSHYIFSKTGEPVIENAPTVLATKTLRAQKIPVYEIPYFSWNKKENKAEYLKALIPSLQKNAEVKQEAFVLPSKKISSGQSVFAFWQQFDPQSLLDDPQNSFASLSESKKFSLND